MVPIRMVLVLMATAANPTHGSAMGWKLGSNTTWSQTKKPSHPATSASLARDASSDASPNGPNGGRLTP